MKNDQFKEYGNCRGSAFVEGHPGLAAFIIASEGTQAHTPESLRFESLTAMSRLTAARGDV